MKHLYEHTVRSRMNDSLAELGIRLVDFLKKAGVHAPQWYSYKNCRESPRHMDGTAFTAQAIRMAEVLGKDPEWLWPPMIPTMTDEELDAPFPYMGEPDEQPPPYADMMRREDTRVLYEAVNALPPTYRDTVLAISSGEETRADMTRRENLSHGAIGARLSYGRERMRKMPELTRDMFTDVVRLYRRDCPILTKEEDMRLCVSCRRPLARPLWNGFSKCYQCCNRSTAEWAETWRLERKRRDAEEARKEEERREEKRRELQASSDAWERRLLTMSMLVAPKHMETVFSTHAPAVDHPGYRCRACRLAIAPGHGRHPDLSGLTYVDEKRYAWCGSCWFEKGMHDVTNKEDHLS